MDWNFIIGIALLYIGLGLAYSQWELGYYFKYGKVRESNLVNLFSYFAFYPVFWVREKLNV